MKAVWYILVIIIFLFAISLFFQTGAITAEGNTRYDTEAIVSASGLKPGGSLFIIDSVGAEQRIIRQFPYIESVSIKRQLPDKLVIVVTESAPLAYITIGDNFIALLDQNAKILDLKASADEGAELRGITPVSCNIGDYYEAVSDTETESLEYAIEILNELVKNDLFNNVTYINASVLNPSFNIGANLTVEVGQRESTADKIKLLTATLPSIDTGYSAIINLTVPGEVHYIPN